MPNQSRSSNQSKVVLTDREILTDALSTERYVTETYNHFANECATQVIRDEVMNILNDEHKMQSDILSEIQSQGWYTPLQAEQQKIQKVYKKFENMKQPNN